jgi:hypothetical protein
VGAAVLTLQVMPVPTAFVVLAKPGPVKPVLLLSMVPLTPQKPVAFSSIVKNTPPVELEVVDEDEELLLEDELELLEEDELLLDDELELLEDEELLLELDEDELELLLEPLLPTQDGAIKLPS